MSKSCAGCMDLSDKFTKFVKIEAAPAVGRDRINIELRFLKDLIIPPHTPRGQIDIGSGCSYYRTDFL